MPREIVVAGRCAAIVDDDMHELLAQFPWRIDRESYIYVRRGGLYVYMHHMVIGAPINRTYQVDHLNHNRVDNRRSNLRFASPSENSQNRARTKKPGAHSQYKGVTWHYGANKWQATLKKDGTNVYLGLHVDEVAAAHAYDKAARELFGEFAYLNFPEVLI